MSNKILFYGKSKPDPKYWPFSNFYRAPFKDASGNIWPTTEHYYQAMKFLPEVEIEIDGKKISMRKYIHDLPLPGDAAREGRRRDFPMRSDWEKNIKDLEYINYNNLKVKDCYMYKALIYKFSQNEDLKQLLLDTGDAEIIEASNKDAYWGWGVDQTGKNMLGKLLMLVREELKEN